MGKKAKKKEGKVDDREAAARRNETELLALQLQLDMRSQEVRSRAGCRRARGGSRHPRGGWPGMPRGRRQRRPPQLAADARGPRIPAPRGALTVCRPSLQLHRAKRDMKIMQEERDEMVRRMEEQKAITQEITSDLTRQYKDMQANLELQIGDLEEENSALLQDISTKEGEMDTILEERNQARAERDKVVGEMKHRMEEMTLEFSNMLRETVETMSLRLDNIPKKERIAPEAKAEILRSRNNSK